MHGLTRFSSCCLVALIASIAAPAAGQPARGVARPDQLATGVYPLRAIWYVAEDGSDTTGTGSAESPFATIQHALDQCQNGDIVQLACGTYQEPAIVLPPSLSVTLRGELPDSACALIEGVSLTGDSNSLVLRSLRFLNVALELESFSGDIAHCEFSGGGITGTYGNYNLASCSFRLGAVVYVEQADLTLGDCDFSEGGGDITSICSDWSPTTLTATNCNLNGGGSIYQQSGGQLFVTDCVLGGHATALSGNEMRVSGCRFEGNGLAIRFQGSDYWPSDCTVEDCTFVANGRAIYLGMAGVEDYHWDEARIANSLFYDNTGAVLAGELRLPETVTLDGCTLAFNQSTAINLSSWEDCPLALANCLIAFNGGAAITTAAQLSCCDLFANAGGDWTAQIAGQLGANGNITADPLFCDAAGDDFSLRSDSPCLDAPGCGQIGLLGQGCTVPTPLFVDIAAAAGLADTGVGRACAWGHIGASSHDDLFVSSDGTGDHLYRNEADGTFSAADALLAPTSGAPTWTIPVDDSDMSTWGSFTPNDDGSVPWSQVGWARFVITSIYVEGGKSSAQPLVGQFTWQGGGVSLPTWVDGGCGPEENCWLHRLEWSGAFTVHNPASVADLELGYMLASGGGCSFAGYCDPIMHVEGVVECYARDEWRSYGAVWGNANADSYLDLFVARRQGSNQLFVYAPGPGSYTEVAASAGLAGGGAHRAATWQDLDQDGFQDLFLARDTAADTYFLNLSTSSEPAELLFLDIAADSLGVADTGAARGATWGDINNDGHPDLYVARYGNSANLLYIYDPLLGVFSERAEEFGVAGASSSMGCAMGDYDNDGDLDMYVTNQYQGNQLYRNDGDQFTDVAAALGVDDGGPGRSCAWVDYDNDGDLDLHVLNAQLPDRLYANAGPPAYTFTDVAGDAGLAAPEDCVSAAWADYDRDGDLDVFVCKGDAPNSLYRNGGNTNHWLHVDLRGALPYWPALGARVRVVAGGQSQIRELQAGSGYLSQDSPLLEFGLGAEALQVDSLTIMLPDGRQYSFFDIPRDQIWSADLTAIGETAAARFGLDRAFPNPFNPRTRIGFSLAEAARVDLRVYDVAGRLVRVLAAGERFTAGPHQVDWQGTDDAGRRLGSGVYFCRLVAGGQRDSCKLVLLR